jgi:hypothetical protein
LHSAVAVGVGFDDAHDLDIASYMSLHDMEVVSQCVEINLSPGRAATETVHLLQVMRIYRHDARNRDVRIAQHTMKESQSPKSVVYWGRSPGD